jgi:hypothetical protein
MAIIPNPPYSPDLAPCDFFLFPKMKLKLKGCWFDKTEEIQAELQIVLDTQTEKDLRKHSKKQSRWWNQCLHGGGNYFKRNGDQKALW